MDTVSWGDLNHTLRSYKKVTSKATNTFIESFHDASNLMLRYPSYIPSHRMRKKERVSANLALSNSSHTLKNGNLHL